MNALALMRFHRIPRIARFTIVFFVVLIQLIFGSIAKAQPSYDFYAQHIQAHLGSEYVQQFWQLTRGDYRYQPHTAQYMVFAFAQGWFAGYYTGSWAPYNHTNGFAEHQRQLETQALQRAQNQVNQWTGLRPDESRVVTSFLMSGWRAGWDRGRNDALAKNAQQVIPQPTQSEFRRYYQPPGLLAAPRSGNEDLWGDLKNTR